MYTSIVSNQLRMELIVVENTCAIPNVIDLSN